MKERTNRKRKAFCALFIMLVIAALSFFALSDFFLEKNQSLQPQLISGQYTIPISEIEPDGKTASFFATGDVRFRYAHDEYGYVLIENDNGYWVYAKAENGRPVPGDTRLNASIAEIIKAPKMSYSDIDFSLNADLIAHGYDINYSENIMNSQSNNTIVNVIIFIEFSNTTFNVPQDNFHSLLTAEDNSLKDYYDKLTYGNIIFESAYPKQNNQIFVYKAPNNRSYYNVTNGQSITRYTRETVLLTDAVNAVSSKISTAGLNLDTFNDNRVDAVTFIMSGSPSSSWGSLLWPHAWNLYDANQSYNNGASAKIGGIEVGNYNMQFEDHLNQGLLCHEMGHVLGAPDLYSYDDASKYAAVAKWDVMQTNQTPPQYMTTFMRDKYIGSVGDNQIQEINYNGVYELKPTVSATQDDILAYKIQTGIYPDEYFMVEYRNNSVSTYDSALPGSGLLIYRINTTAVSGNKNSIYRSTSKPYEVYVFRPNFSSSPNLETKSRADLEYAYLAPNNPYFRSVGVTSDVSRPLYSQQTIYHSNGVNSGIVIEVLSMNSESIEFNVRLSGEDTIDNEYFIDKIAFEEVKLNNSSLFSGVEVNINFENIDLTYLRSLRIELLDQADNTIAVNTLNLPNFYDVYSIGARNITTYYIVNDKGNMFNNIFDKGAFASYNEPFSARLIVEDADTDIIEISTVSIDKSDVDWQTIMSTKREIFPKVSASYNHTVGLRFDGSVSASGSLQFDSYNEVIDISSSHFHTLLLTKSLNVISVTGVAHPRNNVAGWNDIIKISASKNNSYAVTLSGNVVAAGDNTYGQLNITNLDNIKDVKGGLSHVVALGEDGRVYGAGSNEYGQLNTATWSNIVAIDAGDKFTIGLMANGNVLVTGIVDTSTVTLGWGGISKISAGKDFILALTNDNRVLSFGNNQGGKSSVEDLRDIIDISAGDEHSAFLRVDGKVIYKGINTDATQMLANLNTDEYVTVSGIVLQEESITLELSETYTINASVQPANATYKALDYISYNPTVAQVNENGTVTTLAEGEAIIQVKHRGSNVFSYLLVTVINPVLIESIGFDLQERNLVIDTSGFLTLISNPTFATNRNNAVFSSSDESVVSVDLLTGEIFAHQLGSSVITATIDDFGNIFVVTCTIIVIDSIAGIEIFTLPNKLVYQYGENLNLTGGKLKASMVGGGEEYLDLVFDMLTGYDPHNTNPAGQTITVTVDGKTTSFTVWVDDYINSLRIVTPIVTKYFYNQPLNVTGGRFVKVYASGAESPLIEITIAMITGYDPQQFGIQTLTLTFEGNSLDFDIELEDDIIQISPNFSKKTFHYGEHIGADETFIIHRRSGYSEEKNISFATLSNFDSTIFGVHHITLTYDGQEAYDLLTVYDTVESIILEGVLREGRYMFIDNNYPNLSIKALMASGSIVNVGLDNSNNLYAIFTKELSSVPLLEEDFTEANLGQYSRVDIKIMAKKTDGTEDILRVRIVDLINIIEVDYIEVIYAPTYNYSEVTSIDDLNILVKVYDISGNSTIELPDTIDIDLHLFTPQIVILSYLDFFATVQITIINNVIGIESQDNAEIVYGADFTVPVYMIKANGDREVIARENLTLNNFNSYQFGFVNVTINYQGFYFDIMINVIEEILSFGFVIPPQSNYLLYENIDFTGKQIELTYTSLAKRIIDFSPSIFTILPYDNTVTESQDITVKHIASEVSFIYQVIFINNRIAIEVSAESKNVYNYNEALSIIVNEVLANGERKVITGYSHNYNNKLVGKQNVRVSFEGFICFYWVEVFDIVQVLTLLSPPTKTTYRFGEAINFQGAQMKINYVSGNEEITSDFSKATITYNPAMTGDQNVIVTMGTQNCSFGIRINQATQPLLVFNNQTSKVEAGRIMFFESLFIPEIFDKIALNNSYDYLYLSLERLNGSAVDVFSSANSNVYINSTYRLIVKNLSNQNVVSYTLSIYGDINNDGIFNYSDLTYYSEELLKEAYSDRLDYSKNGSYDLIDFINWIKAVNSEEPKPVTAKDFFNNIITDIKRKDYA